MKQSRCGVCLKCSSSAEKRGCLLLTKIKANTVNTCFLCKILKNINWEHVEFDEGKSQFLLFLVAYHILSETEI